MFTALRAMFRDPTGKVILVWALAQVLIGTVVYRWLEGWSLVDALYFSVVTLATVGFGDLHPTTDVAKLFTVLYIVSGLGVIAAFITELTKHRASTIARFRPNDRTAGSDQQTGPAEESPTETEPDPT